MICPNCNSENTTVLATRQFPAYRRRRYKCLECEARFTTKEWIVIEERGGMTSDMETCG